MVIPARLGASRLPRKPLRLLGGAPLVVRVWERVRALNLADRCVVATDSAEVAAAVRAAGAECALTAQHHPSGTDRVAEVAARPEYARYQVVVNVQGDEPFVSAAMIRGAADVVSNGRMPLGTVAAPATREHLADPNVVKVVCADDGRAMYFSRSTIPYLRDGTDGDLLQNAMRRHVGIYAYTPQALARWVGLPEHPLERIERLEQLRPLAAGIPMGVALVEEPPPIGIDTEEDLERANERWSQLNARR